MLNAARGDAIRTVGYSVVGGEAGMCANPCQLLKVSIRRDLLIVILQRKV